VFANNFARSEMNNASFEDFRKSGKPPIILPTPTPVASQTATSKAITLATTPASTTSEDRKTAQKLFEGKKMLSAAILKNSGSQQAISKVSHLVFKIIKKH
jgi:hypothetical protein